MRVLTLSAALILSACSATSTDTEVVDVYAASSLADAYSELESRFEAANPDIDIRLNLAGSNVLLRQILDGADAEVYAPADVDLLDGLEGRSEVYATNRLTLVVPAGSEVSDPAVLADDSFLVARCAAGVPCGDATDRWLDAASLTLGRATEELNVRAALLKVSSGEADAGFVYVTDALARPDEVVAIPLDDPPMVELALAVLTDDSAGAATFADYVASDEGTDVFRSLGFELP